MSAIFGIFHTNGRPVEEPEVEKLLHALNRVCFDRKGLLKEGSVLLGVLLRQLIHDPSEPALPSDALSGMSIAADARLDNREDLAVRLGIPKEQLPGYPDSLLILKAYMKWEDRSPEYLLGDFAYVIYDKNRRRFFCARDHVGIRPFYYYWIQGTFSFCTLHPPIMATCPVSPTPNDSFIVSSFIRSFSALSETFANEIRRLPPGHSITVDDGGLKMRSYWKPVPGPLLKLSGEAEYAEALREVFTEAVRCRIRSSWPVGSQLSSGLDSASIAALAARELRKEGKRPLAFSWSPEPKQFEMVQGDERNDILELCRREEIECAFSELKPEEFPRMFEELVYVCSGAIGIHEAYQTRTTYRKNCRIMLSGWGGDEFTSFLGNRGYHVEIITQNGLFYFLREIYHLKKNKFGSLRGSLYATLLPYLPGTLLKRFTNYPLHKMCESLIHHDLAALVREGSRKRTHGIHRSVKQFQCRYVLSGVLLSRIEPMSEWGEMHGVNYHYPVLDKRVIEFILSVPTDQLCRHGWQRYLFRRAMEGILTPAIQWKRSKHEPALWKNGELTRSFLEKRAKGYIEEAGGLPVFQRYFEAKAVEKMLSTINGDFNPYKAAIIRSVYAYSKFLDRAFP